ncbi:MAG TPA: hypothetical protein VJM12_18490 [Pyrinomonadaceae bacterium]|nr:hypothetical protein [Pyrinomonadaceae bacterium]
MRKLIIGLAAMFIFGGSTSSVSPQEAKEVSTRFGRLSVDEHRILLFKGQPLDPPIEGNNSLDLGELTSIGPTDVVLVTNNGGTGCPFTYYFVSASASGAKGTPFFGTCNQLISMKRKGDSIVLILPGFYGPAMPAAARRRAEKQRHVFVYRGGVVYKNGKPVK